VRQTTSYPVRPVRVSAHIRVPPEELLRFIADTRNDPLWCPNVESVELVDGDTVDVGWVYPLLARRTLKDQFRRLTEHFE